MSIKRALYLAHGGGPLPVLGDPAHAEMNDCLKNIAASIKKPEAIILVSAHWEASNATVTSNAHPELIYDYYGFPDESYKIQYPSPGHPELANKILTALSKKGIDNNANAQRGFDHGHFVPLKIMYPDADIRCVQLSLIKGLDPKQHIALGQVLQDIADESILLIGSGFSFHNLQALRDPENEHLGIANQDFEKWLINTCASEDLDEHSRQTKLIEWQEAPNARDCHPREEHLLPLHVCYGYAETAATHNYQVNVMQKQASMFLWDDLLS